MDSKTRNTGTARSKALQTLVFLIFISCLSAPIYAQNTKGDKPKVTNNGNRQSRFRIPFKRKDKTKPAYSRVKGKRFSPANSARAARPGKASASKNIYPQRGRFVNNPSRVPKNNQRAWHGTASGSRLKIRSSTGKTRNVYPQYGRYVNNPSRKPTKVEHPVSNKATLARLNRLQGGPDNHPGRKKKVVPRSASRSFISHRSTSAFAQFPRPKQKGEQATTKDIAGRKLRGKNFQTKTPGIMAPTQPYFGRKRVGDRPYKGGSVTGGYVSATRTGEKAWSGDVAGRKIRGRNYSSKVQIQGEPVTAIRRNKVRVGDRPFKGILPGGGYKSATKPSEKRTGKNPLPPRTPGIGANGIGNFQGNIKAGRPAKGGGSISGRTFNNKGKALPPKTPGIGADRIGTFQGNIKAGRPAKGGGSVSGKTWNNKQSALAPRIPSRYASKAASSPGHIRRFELSPGFRDQGEEFTGYTKAKKPVKGGGSISGKLWNNRQQPLPNSPPSGASRIATFQGNIKSRRPEKGGGSVSGKLWNNKETAIPIKAPSAVAEKAANYKGSERRFQTSPGFNDQGEEFTGYIKLKKFKKNYIQNKNAADEALKKRRPDKSTYAVAGLQVKVKTPGYTSNPNAADEALKKLKPSKTTYQVGELQVKVKQGQYGKKPHAAEGAMLGIKPSKSSVKASEYARSMRRTWDYIHNPSSADEALKVKEPGKAFARASDYQGNIKMRKFDLFGKRELHPDAKFVKLNKNNVAEERDLLTNFKLWWARLFKKNDTQPDHLKDKTKKPRYDNREQGLWNE